MGYRIPLFDLNFDFAEQAAVREVLESGWISTGPKCAEFERAFAAAIGARHALTTSSCTAALHLALRLLNVGQGDEVICPSLTFVATANAIRYVGATPVFADIVSADEPNIDPAEVDRLVTERTRAVMVMHYAGFPCRMDEIGETASRHGLRIVEDACHGPLSEHGGRKLGTIGDIGCFSFFSNKNISTGEGGMLVTDDDALIERARLLRSHGMTTMSFERASGHATRYDVVDLGYNYRMDDIRAGIGLAQLAKLPRDLERRQAVRDRYLDCLGDEPQLVVPFAAHRGPVSNYVMPVALREGGAERRDAIRERLRNQGIETSVHYPPVHLFSIYRPIGRSLPVTEAFADSVITLPMHGALGESEVEDVCAALRDAVAGG